MSAYRLVPVHSRDRHLFGLSKCMWIRHSHLACSAPKLFMAVADAIGWALWQASITLHIHYLDDFLFFVPPLLMTGHSVLAHILEWLGVPVAHHRIEGPAPIVSFLGTTVDTVRFELRLPIDKIEYLQSIGGSGGAQDFDPTLIHCWVICHTRHPWSARGEYSFSSCGLTMVGMFPRSLE